MIWQGNITDTVGWLRTIWLKYSISGKRVLTCLDDECHATGYKGVVTAVAIPKGLTCLLFVQILMLLAVVVGWTFSIGGFSKVQFYMFFIMSGAAVWACWSTFSQITVKRIDVMMTEFWQKTDKFRMSYEELRLKLDLDDPEFYFTQNLYAEFVTRLDRSGLLP